MTEVIERRTVKGERQVHRTQFSPDPIAPTAIPGPPDPPSVQPARPEPARAVGRAIYFNGNISEMLPPPLDRSALDVLVESRGVSRLIADLEGGLAYGDRLVKETLPALQHPHTRDAAVARLTRLASDRAAYGARLAALDGTPPPGLPVPWLLVRWVGSIDPAATIDQAMQARRAELDGIENEIARVKQIAGDDALYLAADRSPGKNYPDRGCMDNLLAQLSALIHRRTEVADQLDQLGADRADVIHLVAARVKAAVETAGGVSALTAAVTAASTMSATMTGRPAELDQVEGDLAKLAAGGVTEGAVVDVLAARKAELLADVDAARSASAGDRKARSVEMVKAAIAGSEAARADLERLARSVPRAFPAGFGDAIGGARFDVAVMAELTALVS